jgi:NTE family protein
MAEVRASLQPCLFRTGDVLVREGNPPSKLYIIQSGLASVSVAGLDGRPNVVAQLGSGSVIGEMSLLTGDPAAATVEALTDVVALGMTEAEFHRIALEHPAVYRGMTSVLARKLASTNARFVRSMQGRVVSLVDDGSPALLGYALACSVAWHTRLPTALVQVCEGDGDGVDVPGPSRNSGAVVHRFPSDEAGLMEAVERLRHDHAWVLVQHHENPALPFEVDRIVRLEGQSSRAARNGADLTLRGWTADKMIGRFDATVTINVPEPVDADAASMRLGFLPIDSPAARAIGWAARRVTRLSVGVALGAGGAKGYAHIGALRALTECGVPVDYLSGASVGAVAACMHACGMSPEEMVPAFHAIGTGLVRPALPGKSIASNRRFKRAIAQVFGDRRLEDLDIPTALVATDLLTQREVDFRRGLVRVALVASATFPGVWPTQRIGPYQLIDGGVLSPVPTGALARMGADVLIGVKVSKADAPPPVEAEALDARDAGPWFVHTLIRAIEIMQGKINTDTVGAATIPIEVDYAGAEIPSLRRFPMGRPFVERGEEAVERAAGALAAVLPWLRPL